MKFDKPVPVTTIARLIGAEITGNKNGNATGINELHKVEEGDLAFVDHPKYYDTCIHSAATFIIINKKTDCPEGKALLIVDEPFEAETMPFPANGAVPLTVNLASPRLSPMPTLAEPFPSTRELLAETTAFAPIAAALANCVELPGPAL